MTSKKMALGSMSGATFQGVKWSLSLVGALAASLLIFFLETHA